MQSLFAANISETIQTLEKKLPGLSPHEKISVLNELADNYQYISVPKTLQYGEKALALARKHNDLKGQAGALRNLCIVSWKMGDFKTAQEKGRQSLEIFKQLNEKVEIARTLRQMGYANWRSDKYDEAIDCFKEGLRLAKDSGNQKVIADLMGNMASVYRYKGQLDKDMEYQLNALEIRKKIGYTDGIAYSFENLGWSSVIQKKYDNALDYFKQARELFEKTGNKWGLAFTIVSCGHIYHTLFKRKKAMEYFMQALKIREEIGGKMDILDSLFPIGEVYSISKTYDKALEYFMRALRLAQELGSPANISQTFLSIARIYKELHDYDKALDYSKKGLETARDIGYKELIARGYRIISGVYTDIGNYKEALRYSTLFWETRQEIFNEKISKQVTEIQTKYDTLKKDKEIETLKKDSEIRELKLKQQIQARNAAIIVSLLLIILFSQFFRRYHYLFKFWKKRSFITHYKLQDKIGSGGMGDIYRAKDVSAKARSSSCAVKILKEEFYKDEKYRARFKNEAAIIDGLQHPNIVRVLERGEHDETLYIAMELLEGENLFDFLEKEKKLDLKTALIIMSQAAGALKEIHKRGIIHRDLKPENIMVTRDGQNPPHIKILDFGLARAQNLTRLTRTGTIMGTIFYIAPEQLSGAKVLPAGDIYSLGVIYYLVLTGNKPFSGDTAFDLARRILKTEPPGLETIRPGLPTELTGLVKQMMSKKPDARPSAAEVLERLIKIAS